MHTLGLSDEVFWRDRVRYITRGAREGRKREMKATTVCRLDRTEQEAAVTVVHVCVEKE